jgi:dethiobiotin synthetase
VSVRPYVAQALLRAHVAAGRRAVGMKPVAAGIADGAAVNADVAALAAAGNVEAPLADRNPYAFASAVAPHPRRPRQVLPSISQKLKRRMAA